VSATPARANAGAGGPRAAHESSLQEVSSDAEWIWRAAAEDGGRRGGRRPPDSSIQLAGASAEYHPVSGYDGKPLFITQSDYPGLLARPPGQTEPGRSPVTSHRRAPHCSPPHRHQRLPRIGSHRGRRLDAQPPAEVLARIGIVVNARGIGLRDRCLLAGTGDQRGPVALPDDQRAAGQAGSVVWSPTRSASVMAGMASQAGSGC